VLGGLRPAGFGQEPTLGRAFQVPPKRPIIMPSAERLHPQHNVLERGAAAMRGFKH